MVDLSTIEVGNNVKLRNGTIRTVVAEQYIQEDSFSLQDEAYEMITLNGGEPNLYRMDGTYIEYGFGLDIVEIYHTPQRCVVVNINDQPHAVYKNSYPSSEQILDCINAYGGFVPEIKMDDNSSFTDGNFLVDLEHEQCAASSFKELINTFLTDENITELNFEQNIMTMDVFELETGNGKGAVKDETL